jgi:hypothetical protein
MNKYQQTISDSINHVSKGNMIMFRPRCNGKPKMFYKLDKNKNVVPSSMEEWATFIEGTFPANYKHVGDDIVNGHRVSTVFLGLCQNFDFRDKTPIVFETMVFQNDRSDIYQERYATWKQAEEGHQRAIEWVKNGCKEDER